MKSEKATHHESRNGSDQIDAAIDAVRDGPVATSPATHIPLYAMSYWNVVQKQQAEAQQELQQAQALEQQAQQLRVQATAKQGAWESYVLHLSEVCDFNPRVDRVESDGKIVRAEATLPT